MTNTIYTVYKITNTINNKIYIGVHATQNPNDSYMGSGNAIKSAILKYGKENFTKEILFTYDNELESYSKEKELVTETFITKADNYNLKVGGYGGVHSKESRQNMSNSAKKKPPMKESTKKLISIYQTKKTVNTSTKMKLSKSQSGSNNSMFIGYYIIPHGKFTSVKLAFEYSNIPISSIRRWCKTSDKVINNNILSKSKYLQSLKESPLGKTFKEIGFDFKA